MNQNSSTPSSDAWYNESTTPDLIEIVQDFVRAQFPDANVHILYRWGKELLVNNVSVGCIIKNKWETWHWEKDVKTEKSELPGLMGFKIVADVRVTEKSIHVSDPLFFDIIKRDCGEVIYHGK